MTDYLVLWENTVRALFKTLPKSKVMTWFLHSTIKNIQDDTVIIATSRTFYVDFITKSKTPIITALQNLGHSINDLQCEVDGSLESTNAHLAVDMKKLFDEEKQSSENSNNTTVRKLPKQSSVRIKKGEETYISKMLDEAFTLRNFVIGEENQLAHAACQAVAHKPGGAYNPLFLYGSVGLGKTHLLQATANEILRKYPNKLVVYLTTENFIAEVVEAIQKRKMDQVRKKYRQVDVFILDDIQFLAGKDRTQEIFFHLFNDLYNGKKQMIFSSDRPPMELEVTEERLKSRFSMGMIADVQFPEFETRLAISKVKAQEAGIMLDDEILNFIAYNVHHSIREVQGVILQTKAMIELSGHTPTIDSVSDMLSKLNKEVDIKRNVMGVGIQEVKKIETMEELVSWISEKYHVQADDVKGSKRSREFMIPRQISMYLIKKHLNASLQAIGNFFSGRDHTSVLHATRKVAKQIKEDPDFWKEIKSLEESCSWQ